MKILIIYNEYLYKGGEDTYIQSLISLLKNKGHKVFFYKKSSLSIKTLEDKIKLAFRLFYNNKTHQELSLVIKKFNPDIAHFHNIFPLIGATAYRVCHQYKVPIIQHIHNYRFVCPKTSLYRNGKICELCPKRKTLIPSLIYGCYHSSRVASFIFVCAFYYHKLIGSFSFINQYIFPSIFTQRYYQKYLGLTKKQIDHLPYFIDVPKKIIKPPIDYKYYLFVGRLTQEKGIVGLLEQFSKIQENIIIMGDGPLKDSLYQKYKKFKHIKFINYSSKKKVYSYIKYSKAVVIPSEWYEVLPLVYLEAISFGKKILLNRNNLFISETGLCSLELLDVRDKHLGQFQLSKNGKIQPLLKIKNSFHYKMLKRIYKKYVTC